jgi:thiamine transport system permease protein
MNSIKPAQSKERITALLLWAVPLLFLFVFFFYPFISIFSEAGRMALAQNFTIGNWNRVFRPLGFTFWQAFISMLLTMLIGMPAAYVFSKYSFPGKNILKMLTTIPFILPTVVVAASFNALVGPKGLINIGLINMFGLSSPPISFLNTLTAILVAHVFYNTSVIIRVVGSAWSQLDTRLENAARVLGASGWTAFREITLPLLKPSILAAAILVFLFDFTSFGVVLLLGGPGFATLEVEIYIQALHLLNIPFAAILSAIQLVCTLALTLIQSGINKRQEIPITPRLKGENLRKPVHMREKLFVGITLLVIFMLLITPLIALSARSFAKLEANRGERGDFVPKLTLEYYRELFINRRGSLFYVPPIAAIRNSLIYALATVCVSLPLGLLAGMAFTRNTRINQWLNALVMLPLGASAVTLGLGFIIGFNKLPINFLQSPTAIPLVHSLVALPFVVRTIQPALLSIPDNLRQAASVLGASPWVVWREIDWPIISRAALVAAIFSFTISLGEFGATTFISRPEFPTMPVAIYRFLSQPGALNYGQAMAMSNILMVVCGASILLLERLQGNGVREI